jgi:hypothetical protein
MLERLRWLFATVDRPTFRNVADQATMLPVNFVSVMCGGPLMIKQDGDMYAIRPWDDSDISQESK